MDRGHRPQANFERLAGMHPSRDRAVHVRIRVYPDAAHGFLFQYPTEVAAGVNATLA